MAAKHKQLNGYIEISGDRPEVVTSDGTHYLISQKEIHALVKAYQKAGTKITATDSNEIFVELKIRRVAFVPARGSYDKWKDALYAANITPMA